MSMVEEKKSIKLPSTVGVKPKPKVSTAMPDTDLIEKERKTTTEKVKKLKLNEDGFRPAKTRSELYNELAKDEEILDKDVIEYPTPISRGIALVFDLAFNGGVLYLGFKLFPLLISLIQVFLDKYKLVFMFGSEALEKLTFGATELSFILIFIVIPGAFFNTSFGKKIMGLRVRGEGQFTIGMGQVFQREVLFKPLSIALVVGFILPFFDDKKRSLHDRFAKTFVIKD